MQFRFLHVADLHLDSPFVGLRSAPEHISKALEEATFSAYDRVIDVAIEREVAFILVAGDVYDGRDRSLRAQLRFRDGLARLAQSGIESFVVFGNHDPLDGWSARIAWPEQTHLFNADRVTCLRVVRDGMRLATVYGMSHGQKDVRENLARRFMAEPDTGLAIGLLHANVEGIGGHENYAPCSLEDLDAAGMDYWALGHVHNRQVLRTQKPAVVYPGNTQGRSRAEAGERHCCLVSVDADRLSQELVPVDAVRWLNEEVAIGDLADDQELLDQLDGRCREIMENNEARRVVCSIDLIGSGDLHHNLSRPGYVDGVLEHLRGEHSDSDPFVWVDRLRVRTAPEFDREERKRAQDFAATLLEVVDEMRAQPEAIGEIREELAPLETQMRKALGSEFAAEGSELLTWLDRAEAVCLELLEGDRG